MQQSVYDSALATLMKVRDKDTRGVKGRLRVLINKEKVKFTKIRENFSVDNFKANHWAV